MELAPPRRAWRVVCIAVTALALASCGSDDNATDGDTTTTSHPAPVENVVGDHPPGVDLTIEDDPDGGWTVTVGLTNFTFADHDADQEYVPGRGHVHLWVGDLVVAQLDEATYHLTGCDVEEGDNTITVDLNGSHHVPLAIDGEPIAASTTLTVEPGEAMEGDDCETGPTHEHGSDDPGHEDAGHEDMGHDEGLDPTDADVALAVEVSEGTVIAGGGRHEIDLGSVVAITVASDAADDVHVHGYDLLIDVSPDDDGVLVFTADIPGVWEVELEGTGLLLVELEVS